MKRKNNEPVYWKKTPNSKPILIKNFFFNKEENSLILGENTDEKSDKGVVVKVSCEIRKVNE